MEGANKFINDNAVFHIQEESDVLFNDDQQTYKIEEFIEKLARKIKNYDDPETEQWFNNGVSCEILAPNQQWQTGKIRICLQFIPDKPESILDDIRLDNQ